MGRKERQEARAQRRKQRAAKKERKEAALAAQQKAKTDLGGPTYTNLDPLKTWDKLGNPAEFLRDYFRPVATPVRAGFLCCGGPSYREIADSRINAPGVATVGVNNTARDINCDVAVFCDPAIKFHTGMLWDHKVMKLLPRPRAKNSTRLKVGDTWHNMPFQVKDCPNVFFFDKDQDFYPGRFLTTSTASWGVNKNAKLKKQNPYERHLNTFFLGLRICHFLGIRRLYLLGVDFSMSPGKEYGFASSSSNEGRARTNDNSYRIARQWCRELRPIFDGAGFNVFNVNPDSKLDAFDYVPWETAITDAQGPCPQPPYDFQNWYEKVDKDVHYGKSGYVIDGGSWIRDKRPKPDKGGSGESKG